MGCSSSNETKNNRPKRQLEIPSEVVASSNQQARPEKIKGSLGNRRVGEYNEFAKKITKYWRNQQPPTDEETQYIDDVFPPNNNSIFGKDLDGNPTDTFHERTSAYHNDFDVNENDIEWYTAEEIFPGKHSLFEDKIEFDDIKQGSVGNCYFMSALSSMTEFPELLVEIFRTLKTTKNGCYEVVMRINGVWQVILLDNYFPCNKNSKKPIFCKSNGNEIWVMLLEKAWAKVNGGYLNIVSGLATDVLSAFTNFPTEYILINSLKDEKEKEELWEKLKTYEKNNYIMATSTHSNIQMDNIGLVAGHAFSLISIKEANIGGKRVRLLKIRNPWGYKEWKGNWSDNSKLWTDETKSIFGYTVAKDDGSFFIEYSDYLHYFGTIEICFRQSNICAKYLQCNRDYMDGAHVYELTVYSKSTIAIQGIKRYFRFNRLIPPNSELTLNLLLFKKEGGNLKYIKAVGDSQRNPLIKSDLDQGKYLIYAIANYNDNTYDKRRKWIIEVTSTGFFDFDLKDYDNNFSLLKELMKAYSKDNATQSHESFQQEIFPCVGKSSLGAIVINNKSGYDYKISGYPHMTGMRIIDQQSPEDIEYPLKNGLSMVLVTVRDKFYSGYSLGTSGLVFDGADGLDDPQGYDISNFIQNFPDGDYTSSDNYTWIHKQMKMDMSKVTEKVDENEVMRNYIKTTYSEIYDRISKYTGPQDGIEVQFHDKYDFGNGSYYLGQWQVANPIIRHGVGYYDWYSSGNWYAGEFKDGKFNGKGTMGWSNGSYIEIGFKDGQMHGTGVQYQGESAHPVEYSNGQFKQWL